MTFGYQAYPEYKDSGVEWLGVAPKHWNIIPVGRLFKRTKRTGHVDKELLSVYRDYGVIPKSSRDDNNNKPSEDLSPYQLVKENDLVMNKMKTWQGSIAISEYEGIVSPAYFVYEPLAKLFEVAYPKYIHYLLRNPMYIAQYLRRSKGIRVSQWDLDPDEFKRVELLLPAKPEQQQIADFLDHETAKIDTLIEKQQQLITLLKEKRQAVISHAVTKGLNPDAPMRDSGVEWLGEVPEHWGVGRLKNVLRIRNGKDYKQIEVESGGYPVYGSGGVFKRGSDYLFDGESVLFGRKGTIDKPLVVKGKFWTVDTMFFSVLNKYVDAHFVHAQSTLFPFELLSTSTALPSMTQEDLLELRFVIPPYEEQLAISEAISFLQNKYSLIIGKSVSQITLLQERRSALISAAVTGKIDVRNWQAPTPTANQPYDKAVVA